MKMTFIKISIIATLLITIQARIVDPSSNYRVVEMEQTFQKLVDFIKSGSHEKYRNTDDFNENHYNAALGKCGPGVEPQAWKFLGYTVAQIKDTTFKSPSWTNHCFQTNWASLKWNGPMEAQITMHAEKRKFPGCSDTYSISDIYNFDLKVVDEEGDHVIIYKFKH
jgi:hypothetical protein